MVFGPDRTLSNINQRTLKDRCSSGKSISISSSLPHQSTLSYLMVLQLSMPHSFFQPLSGQGESTLAGR
ncbi:hypothetical protein MATL_G00068210 [Megalops atlanticus]|uniref:Uncharacterized protein n=1 Tax=Megalops atlanticus TaxID=7932 RepID=A0A9D3Q879_MEGAT|nr:hypothetical protein MATL_G00068210 [Megalops atlanticus]